MHMHLILIDIIISGTSLWSLVSFYWSVIGWSTVCLSVIICKFVICIWKQISTPPVRNAVNESLGLLNTLFVGDEMVEWFNTLTPQRDRRWCCFQFFSSSKICLPKIFLQCRTKKMISWWWFRERRKRYERVRELERESEWLRCVKLKYLGMRSFNRLKVLLLMCRVLDKRSQRLHT